MQLIIYTMQTFLYQLFIHILQHFFQIFIVKCCIMYTKYYKMDELFCTFYRIFIEQLGQGEYKSSLLRVVVTPLSSCDN